jgi:ABC-type oligopeptide transport system substrate-binding subunit
MKLEILDSTELERRINAGDFQVYPTSLPRWDEPAVDMVNFFLSTSPSNVTKYSNPTVDTTLRQLVTETDQAKRVQLVHAAEEQILRDAPVAWYTRAASYTILDKAVRNVTMYYDQKVVLDEVRLSTKR